MSIFSVISTFFGACSHPENIQNLHADDFQEAIISKDVQLLDVRTPREYAAGHLNNSVNINVSDAGFAEKAAERLDKSQPVYVYCRSGQRSLLAARILADKGYKVVNLAGGIMEWTASGKPTTR